MCDRCTVIECAFGSRDPMPPKIASLAVKSTVSTVNETEITHIGEEEEEEEEEEEDQTNCGNTYAGPHERTPNPASSFIYPEGSFPAAIDAKAMPPTPTTTSVKGTPTTSVLASIMGHADVLDALLLNCPDFQTLYVLVASCRTAKLAFEQYPQGMVKAVLETMSQELQYLTTALIGINGSRIGTSRSIKRSMETWLGLGPKPLAERLQVNPVAIVGKLARSFSAIEFFMEIIPKNLENNFSDYKAVLASRVGLDYDHVTEWSNRHPLLQQTEWSDVPDDTEWDIPELPASGRGPQAISLPLNEAETYRMKRALLRYEVFCALFYLGPDKYYDTRAHPHRYSPVPGSCRRRAFCKDQVVFLDKYVNPWETGELAVVSHFMFDLLRNAYFHKYKMIRYNEAWDSWYGRWGNSNHGHNRHDDHEEVVDEFDNHLVWFASQGLTLLRKIYHDRKGFKGNEQLPANRTTMSVPESIQAGYHALVKKHGEPRYRAAELFVPFEKCADRQGLGASDPNPSWKPRHTWSDTTGMEKPSKGWLAKGPASDNMWDSDAYWGEKWTRKMGYFIWDRD